MPPTPARCSPRPGLRMAVSIAAVLALVATPARAFFFHRPHVDGAVYSYEGDGDALEDPGNLFKPDDTFTDVTLSNWDLSGVSSLNLPSTVQKLTLTNCKLDAVPDEVRALENLLELNLGENTLTAFNGTLAAVAAMTKLNVSNNALVTYNLSLPELLTLDLSSNELVAFPNVVFASSQLDSFRVKGNGFEIAAMSSAQYDFFAGLSDFQASFRDVSSCAKGQLVYLHGKGVCRLEVASAEDPAIVMKDRGTVEEEPEAPMATVGVVIPGLPDEFSGNLTKKYVIYGVVALVVIGVIAGIVALVSLGIASGVARAVYDYISKSRQERFREGLHEETPLFFDQGERADYQKEMAAGDRLFPSNDPVLVTYRVDYDSVKLIKKLAQGAFGEVWVGQYRGGRVAIKRLLQDQVSLATSEDFLREIKLMAWMEHPKIIKFIGVAWTRLVDMLAVIEYMDNGDLRSFLDSKPPKQLSWKEGGVKLQYARDAIDAVVYLHSLSPTIIHRDLKSRNILLDSKKGAKLGDFGISATKRENDMTAGVGTARWLAPELARGEEHYTEAVDVYAFGIILSELDTHQLPFADARSPDTGEKLNDMAILQGVSSGKLQVALSASCPANLCALARSCMHLNPAQRPTAAEVAYQLRKRDLFF